MADFVRLVRKSGTQKFNLVVGGEAHTLSKMQTLHLFDDVFRAIYGAEFNKSAIKRD